MKLPRMLSGAGIRRDRIVGRLASCRGHRRQDGATLPIVLVLTAMLQLLALAQADTALIALRTAGARRDRLIALVAADSGLVLCSRLLAQGAAPVRPWSGPGEPAYWRSGHAFSAPAPAAFVLRATGGGSIHGPDAANGPDAWPGSAGPPLCLIESRPMAQPLRDQLESGSAEAKSGSKAEPGAEPGAEPERQTYLLTVRGLGAHAGTQSYLQQIEFDPYPAGISGGVPQMQGWRSVAAAPDG